MSFDAIRWALAQCVSKSSAKFLLVAMADCVNEKDQETVCWPSMAHLSSVTSLDRKTVLSGIKFLEQEGFIEDTGNKRGQTKQVVVYRLKTSENGTVSSAELKHEQSQIPTETSPKTDCFGCVDGVQTGTERGLIDGRNGAENGTVEQAQKRNSTESGTVPLFPSKGPVFPAKGSRFSHERVPKTGHGTSKEPVTEPVMESVNSARRQSRTSGITQIPGVDDKLLADYLVIRKSKKAGPLTETALQGIVREAASAGLSTSEALRVCCEKSWVGFKAEWHANATGLTGQKRGGAITARQPSSHSGFAKIDYTKGIDENGYITL